MTCPKWQRRADDDRRSRSRRARRVLPHQLLVGDEQYVTGAKSVERPVTAREAKQFGAPDVGRAVRAEGEVFHAGKRCLRTARHAEGPCSAGALDDDGQEIQCFVREHR